MNNNVIKKRKIINGVKYYELNINKDNYIIDINNIPKEDLIKFKVYISRSNELNISNKESYIIYENDFNLEYFINQTPFLTDIGIKNINDLIRFLYTYFKDYNDKSQNLINYINNNPNIIILKLQLFHNKININIELYDKINYKNNINNKINNILNEEIKMSNSCKNLFINKKELKHHDNKKAELRKSNDNDLMDYYISIIQKKIPLLQKLTKEKIYLIYKSSQENENKNFHLKCDDKGPTLVFIDTEENRSFIAFNKKSWHLIKNEQIDKVSWRETNIKDENLAIIDLFSKKKIEMKKNNREMVNNKEMNYIQQYANYGPSYVDGNGFSFKIFGEDKYLSISFITKTDEEEDYIRTNYNLDKNNFLHIKDYEVYAIKRSSK